MTFLVIIGLVFLFFILLVATSQIGSKIKATNGKGKASFTYILTMLIGIYVSFAAPVILGIWWFGR